MMEGCLGGVGWCDIGKRLYFMEGVCGLSVTQCCTLNIAIVLHVKLAATEYSELWSLVYDSIVLEHFLSWRYPSVCLKGEAHAFIRA
jgi:hypothetical protein